MIDVESIIWLPNLSFYTRSNFSSTFCSKKDILLLVSIFYFNTANTIKSS